MATAIYTRISLDSQDGAGVARQESDCRALAEREGLPLAGVYCDNSVSAYSGARRPQFEALIDDVKRGHINTVLVWSTDRLYRRMTDLERLVDDLRDVPVLACKSGRVDLSTADGRLHARMLGSVAQHSSEKTAERVTAATVQRVNAGRSTTGSRPFGWARTEGGLRPDPIEGPALAEAYRMLLAGVNLSAIARHLTGLGFQGSKGGPITQARVSAYLRQPRHGGLVAYRGELVEVGNAEGRIVDETTWRQAQRILTDPSRRPKEKGEKGGPGRPANSMLSKVLSCYKCGGIVRPSSNQSRAGVRYKTYACESNHVSWRREDLDALVDEQIEAWLTQGTPVLQEAAAEAAPGVQRQLLADIERLRADRDGLAEALAAGTLSVVAYTTATALVETRLAEAEARLLPAVPSRSRGILDADDVIAAWRSAKLDARRALISDVIEGIVVHPKRTGRIEVTWR